MNYQNIPELKNNEKEMEFKTSDKKRIDLILKDQLSGRPVIVEFKLYDLDRETIGQILEYKTRIVVGINDEDNILFKIFRNKLVTPKTVLVVRHSDEYGRIACNLQNIELFEYGNIKEKLLGDIQNEYRKSIEDFAASLHNVTPRISSDRADYLTKNVYDILEELFRQYKIESHWLVYKNYEIGEWWSQLKYCFLNKWLFKNEDISIGVYEDILEKGDLSVCICYYSKKEEKLRDLEAKLKNEDKNEVKMSCIKKDAATSSYHILEQRYDPAYFYNNVKDLFDFNLKVYLDFCGQGKEALAAYK
jgi:hypothetical protein